MGAIVLSRTMITGRDRKLEAIMRLNQKFSFFDVHLPMFSGRTLVSAGNGMAAVYQTLPRLPDPYPDYWDAFFQALERLEKGGARRLATRRVISKVDVVLAELKAAWRTFHRTVGAYRSFPNVAFAEAAEAIWAALPGGLSFLRTPQDTFIGQSMFRLENLRKNHLENIRTIGVESMFEALEDTLDRYTRTRSALHDRKEKVDMRALLTDARRALKTAMILTAALVEISPEWQETAEALLAPLIEVTERLQAAQAKKKSARARKAEPASNAPKSTSAPKERPSLKSNASRPRSGTKASRSNGRRKERFPTTATPPPSPPKMCTPSTEHSVPNDPRPV